MARIAVMGAGSWGTAVGKVLADAGSEVVMWARREEAAADINDNHSNSKYLPDVVLPPTVTASTDPAQVLDGAKEVVLAVPSQSLRANLDNWVDLFTPGVGVISLAKGIETGTLKRISEVVSEVAGLPDGQIAVLSGPNLAREVAAGQPAATVMPAPATVPTTTRATVPTATRAWARSACAATWSPTTRPSRSP